MEFVDRFIATQYSKSTITKQLEDGIRYLDIRCCAINGVFTIHHGDFYLNTNLGNVLNDCVVFLNEFNSETIIMRIQQENSSISDQEFLNIFNTHYTYYLKFMYLNSKIPNIGSVRGKIVILSNVLSVPGISYRKINVQDDYTDTIVPSKREKINHFANESAKANRNGSSASLYLNHCSATNPPAISPESFAKELLPSLHLSFKEGVGSQHVDNSRNEAPHIGIIAMDFYTKNLVSEIIKRNENKYFKNLSVYSIYNNRYGKHYFYASKYMDSAMQRRQIFGWKPGNKIANGYWLLIPYDGTNKYYIFNTYYKEFLYASTFVTDNRRTVFTWGDAVLTQESVWIINNKNTIYNTYYGCYLYESSLFNSEEKKIVACWAPGEIVSQAYWNFEFDDKSV